MNSNIVLTKFTSNYLRPASDQIMSAVLVIETLLAEYNAHGAKTLIEGQAAIEGVQAEVPAMTAEQLAEVIDDKATEEGRPIYVSAYVKNSMANLAYLLAQINTPDPVTGYTMRQSLSYMATNPRNPLLGR